MPCAWRSSGIAALGALLLAGCAAVVHTPAPHSSPSAIVYEIQVASTSPCVVDATATLRGGAERLVADEPSAIESVVVEDERGVRPAVRRDGGTWAIACASTCKVHYRVDLSKAAAASGDSFDVAVRRGNDVLAPAWVWLPRPEPLRPEIPVDVYVHTKAPIAFASGLHASPEPDHYLLQSEELRSAGYSAFGTFETKHVRVHGGVVDVTILAGERAAGDALIARWVADTAGWLDDVYGRFPVAHAQIFVVPDPDSNEITFGRTLPSGGASIAVLVGSKARERDLYDDWILTHEMFHLGVPSFWNEGRWLDEGLATYYEPVLRTRAGNLRAARFWSELAAGMVRGLPGPGQGTLLDVQSGPRAYWGGAAFVLRADVDIRRRTNGRRSLDDGLRAVLERGGDATRIWSVDHFVDVVDAAVGVPVLRGLYSCEADPADEAQDRTTCTPRDRRALRDMLLTLGLVPEGRGSIAIDDGAPLATVRQRIVRPRACGPDASIAAHPPASFDR